jgi:hypothetical protein
MFAERLGTRQTCLDFFAHYFFSACLFERASNGFFFNHAGHNQNAVHIAKDQIAGFDMDRPDFDWASVVHNLRTDAGVLSIAPAAKDGPILGQDLRGIAMKSIDDGAKTTTRPCSRGKNFAPRGTVMTTPRGYVDLTRKYLIQGFRHKAERIFLFSPRVGDLDRHGAPNQAHVLLHGLNGLGQELMRVPQHVQHIAQYRRVETLDDGSKSRGFARCFHSDHPLIILRRPGCEKLKSSYSLHVVRFRCFP